MRHIDDIRCMGGVASVLIGSRMRCEKHGHKVSMDAHWLTEMRQCKQSHMAAVMSPGEGIPWGNPPEYINTQVNGIDNSYLLTHYWTAMTSL